MSGFNNKKTMRKISLLMVFMFVFSMAGPQILVPLAEASGDFAGGDGTKNAPYLVETADHLHNIRNYPDAFFKQTENIDLSDFPGEGESWEPIGSKESPFTGSYDGNDNIIENLTMDDSDLDYAGLFGYTGEGAGFTGISLMDTTINAGSYAGGLAGYVYAASAEDIFISGEVKGANYTGGLIGYIDGSSDNKGNYSGIHIEADVTGNGHYTGGLAGELRYSVIKDAYMSGNFSGSSYLGGLSGQTRNSVIISSHSEGNVDSKGRYVGGLIGYSSSVVIRDSFTEGVVVGSMNSVGGLLGHDIGGDISGCYATGSVESGGKYVGGLVGYARSSNIAKSFARGTVNAEGHSAGGLVGIASGGRSIIAESFATGDVSGGGRAGGLVGYNRDKILNSYAKGIVTSDGNYNGGLIGWNTGMVWNCYTAGEVFGEEGNNGGLIGRNSETVVSSYYDYETTGMNDESKGIPGTTAEMQLGNRAPDMFINWDTEIWQFSPANRYPILRWTAEADIKSFGFGDNVTASTVIDKTDKTVQVEVGYQTDLTELVAKFELTDGFTARVEGVEQVSGITENDFSSPLIYTITAPEGTETDWEVTVNKAEGNEADMLFFSFEEEAVPAIINPVDRDVHIMVVPETALDSLVANFKLSFGASAEIEGTEQASGEDANDFTGPVDYTVIAQDGTTEVDWTVTVKEMPPIFDGGSGKADDPYLVATADQLNNVRDYSGSYFEQTDNINLSDFTGDNWEPIGNKLLPFTGTYKGGGFDIENLYIDAPDLNYAGLFAYIGEDAEFKNISLKDVTINGNKYTGGLAGYIGENTELNNIRLKNVSINGNRYVGGLSGYNYRCDVDNSYITGNNEVSGNRYVGGLAGFVFRGAVTDSHISEGEISGKDYTGGLIGSIEGSFIARVNVTGSYSNVTVSGDNNISGGLIGYGEYVKITDCYAIGSVTGGNDRVGGLVGYSDEIIIDGSYASGEVTGMRDTGGLIGFSGISSITASYAIGDVTGGSDNVGGLVGRASGGVINAGFAAGDVTGEGTGTGGLTGYSNVEVKNCYATGSVSGGDYTGGLTGRNNGEILNSYAAGNVAGTGDNTGGLVGKNNGTVVNSYYDRDTTGMDDTGKGMPGSTRTMQFVKAAPDMYTNWDTEVWRFSPVNRYPILRWTGEAVIESFGFGDDLTASTVIDNTDKTVRVEVAYQTDVTELVAYFDLSDDFEVWVNGTKQESGLTKNDFTHTVTYTLVSTDGTETDWQVTVVEAEGDEADILSFSLPEEVVPSVIDPEKHSIKVTMFEGDDLELAACFEASFGAEVKVEGVEQFSDETKNDFSSPVTYDVLPADGDADNIREWEVTVKEIPPLFSGGKGTENDPYRVATAANLNNVRDFPDDHFLQTDHIDLSDFPEEGESWEPIGTSDSPFNGTYDGNNFKLNNLFIDNKDLNYAGLFGYTGEGSEIRNVDLVNVDITANDYTGGLIGYCGGGSLAGNTVSGQVNGNSSTGGLVGHIEGARGANVYVNDCHALVEVSGRDNRAGGLAGYSRYVEITDCHAAGNVTADNSVGGLAGYAVNTYIKRSFAAGNVSGNNSAGGLVGYSSELISDSYATGKVEGLGDNTGGLVGQNRGDIVNCYAVGPVKGSADNTGGLAGLNTGTVESSYYDWETTETTWLADGKGIPLNTREMQLGNSSGIYAGWDDNIWRFTPAGRYPILKWTGETDIISYNFAQETGEAVIDKTTKTVEVEVAFEAGLTELTAEFELTEGFTARVGNEEQVSGETINDFTEPVIYTLECPGGMETDWVVTVTRAPGDKADILSFGFAEEVSPSVIDPSGEIVKSVVDHGTDLTELVAFFELSPGAVAEVEGKEQVSGETANDFSSKLMYEVTSANGENVNKWIISVGTADLSIQKEGPEAAGEGETVTFAYTVTNTGAIKLSEVEVTDTFLGETWSRTIGNLDAGETVEFSEEYNIPGDAAGDTLWGTASVVGFYNDRELFVSDDVYKLVIPMEPKVISSPENCRVTEGSSAVFRVQAAGTQPLEYQWQRSDDNGNTWNDIANATGTRYTTPSAVYTEDHGAMFRCKIKNKYGTAVSGAATLTVEVGDRTIVAEASPREGGKVTGTGNYKHGTVVTLTATANDGYVFQNWTEGGEVVSSGSSFTFEAETNRILTAVFKEYDGEEDNDPDSFILSYVAGENGRVEGEKTQEVEKGGDGTAVEAVPDAGYRFVQWSDGVTVNPRTDSNVTTDISVTAHFETGQYDIILISNPEKGGTVTGAGTYDYGEEITVSAEANDGFTFQNWTEDGSVVSSDLSYTFETKKDRVLLANFSDDTSEDDPDRVSHVVLSRNRLTLQPGDTEKLTVTVYPETAANKNVVWSSNDKTVATVSPDGKVSAKNTGTVVITVETEDGGYIATCKVTVVESVIRYHKVSVYANPLEGGTVTGGGTYVHGTEVTVRASAHEGYTFVNWIEGGEVLSTEAAYTFSTEEKRELVANFKEDDPTPDPDPDPSPDPDPDPDPDPIDSITLDKSELTLISGVDTDYLTLLIEPETAEGWQVFWSSGNDTVAKVEKDPSGKVKVIPVATGTTDVTVTVQQGTSVYTAKCKVEVIKFGDVTGNGEIEVKDAIKILRHIVGLDCLDGPYREAADVNRDGSVNVIDAVLVLRYVVEIIDKFH